MAKQDFPPLLASGIHRLTMAQLEDLAVKAFPLDLRRVELFNSFVNWCNSLRMLGIVGKLWVDGSFLTEKPNPSDIDCVSFSLSMTRQITLQEKQQLDKLLDHNEASTLYHLDYYMEQPTQEQEFHREAYWKGVFGFQHDRISTKGFVELTL